MRPAVEILQRHGWLAQRSPEAQLRILGCGRIKRFAAAEAIYHYGDGSAGVYGIIRGNVGVSIPNDVGTDQMIYLGMPGFWIGDAALFSDERRLVTVMAETDVEAIFLPRARLVETVRQHPELLRDFYALSHWNLSIALSLVSNFVTPSSEKRLAAFLLNLDRRQYVPGAWIELAQDRLATMLALSAPTVQRQLRSLCDAGLIEVGYARVRVVDPDAMRRFLVT